MSAPVRLAEVLLVEDDPDDIEFARIAFKESRLLNTLHVVEDGEAAMRFVRQQGEFKDAPRPDLILLDLNLPLKNGREVLAELKEDPSLRRIPVVVFTASRAERDVVASYDLGANAYVQKPLRLEGLVQVLHDIEHYWLSVVVLPDGLSEHDGAAGKAR